MMEEWQILNSVAKSRQSDFERDTLEYSEHASRRKFALIKFVSFGE